MKTKRKPPFSHTSEQRRERNFNLALSNKQEKQNRIHSFSKGLQFSTNYKKIFNYFPFISFARYFVFSSNGVIVLRRSKDKLCCRRKKKLSSILINFLSVSCILLEFISKICQISLKTISIFQKFEICAVMVIQ